MLLEDKTAVIYAAGGAIGGAVARSFAREGARLFLTGRTVEKVDAVAKEVVAAGGVAETAQVDALDEKAVDEHLDTVVQRAGAVDISFNAIGPGPAPDRIPLAELAADAFVRPIAFYTTSNFITATSAARRMSDQGSGVIVTLTAVPGRMPARMIGGAAPAWAAVEAFSRSLALGWDIPIDYSPDGTEIVFGRFDVPNRPANANSALFVVRIADGAVRRITPWGFADNRGSWSPDGTKIAFEHRGSLFVVQPDGMGLTKIPLAIGSRSGAGDFDWSPDGTKIVFLLFTQTGPQTFQEGIATANADGSDVQQVTTSPTFDHQADWGSQPLIP